MDVWNRGKASTNLDERGDNFSAGSFRDFSKEKQDLPRLLGARELHEDTRQAVIRLPSDLAS